MLDIGFMVLGTNELEILVKLSLAMVAGFFVGVERKRKKIGLGIRTSMLICIAACLFTIVGSMTYDATNLARIAQGLAAGVGFIGAAIIWKGIKGKRIHELTSAATVWILTAIGFSLGAGLYLIAIIAIILVLIVLVMKRVGVE